MQCNEQWLIYEALLYVFNDIFCIMTMLVYFSACFFYSVYITVPELTMGRDIWHITVIIVYYL